MHEKFHISIKINADTCTKTGIRNVHTNRTYQAVLCSVTFMVCSAIVVGQLCGILSTLSNFKTFHTL